MGFAAQNGGKTGNDLLADFTIRGLNGVNHAVG
jgi:hypothetical protein